eukprot:4362808-Amphidinium_carterae.1
MLRTSSGPRGQLHIAVFFTSFDALCVVVCGWLGKLAIGNNAVWLGAPFIGLTPYQVPWCTGLHVMLNEENRHTWEQPLTHMPSTQQR